MFELLQLIGQLCAIIAGAVAEVILAVGTAPPGQLAAAVTAVVAWLGLACAASAFAERAGRQPGRHLLAGLILPVVYPAGIIAWFALRPDQPPDYDIPPGEQEAEQLDSELQAVPESAGGPADAQQPAAAPGSEPEPQQQQHYNQAYFATLKEQQDNAEIVPGWEITFAGRTITAIEITEALAEVAVVRTRNAEGREQTMRVRYNRIEQMTPLQTESGEQ